MQSYNAKITTDEIKIQTLRVGIRVADPLA